MSLDRFVFLLGSLRLCNIHQGWAMWDERELFQITNEKRKHESWQFQGGFVAIQAQSNKHKGVHTPPTRMLLQPELRYEHQVPELQQRKRTHSTDTHLSFSALINQVYITIVLPHHKPRMQYPSYLAPKENTKVRLSCNTPGVLRCSFLCHSISPPPATMPEPTTQHTADSHDSPNICFSTVLLHTFSIFCKSEKWIFFFKESFFGVLQVCNTKKLNSFKNNIIIFASPKRVLLFKETFFLPYEFTRWKNEHLEKKKKWKRIHFVLNVFIFWSCKFTRPKSRLLTNNILKNKFECKTKNWNPWQILSFGLAKMGIFFSQGVHILVFQVVGLANLQKK